MNKEQKQKQDERKQINADFFPFSIFDDASITDDNVILVSDSGGRKNFNCTFMQLLNCWSPGFS